MVFWTHAKHIQMALAHSNFIQSLKRDQHFEAVAFPLQMRYCLAISDSCDGCDSTQPSVWLIVASAVCVLVRQLSATRLYHQKKNYLIFFFCIMGEARINQWRCIWWSTTHPQFRHSEGYWCIAANFPLDFLIWEDKFLIFSTTKYKIAENVQSFTVFCYNFLPSSGNL